jgi:ribosomal-protein-alanine N-acetyltransferase
MTAPQELRTARLLLRSLEPGDVPALVRLTGAREIAAMTTRIPHPYREQDALDFLAQAHQEFADGRSISFGITILPVGELCGGVRLDLTPDHRRAELGYWIGVPFWSRGYATEAATAVVAFGFDTLGLHKIYAHHFGGNAGSKRVLEKIGMRHEGHLPQHVVKWDRFIDLEIYGLLASDFRGLKKET